MPRVSKEEKEFRAQDDLRTLQRADQIKSDPARVKAAQQLASREMKALQKVAKPTMGRPSRRKS